MSKFLSVLFLAFGLGWGKKIQEGSILTDGKDFLEKGDIALDEAIENYQNADEIKTAKIKYKGKGGHIGGRKRKQRIILKTKKHLKLGGKKKAKLKERNQRDRTQGKNKKGRKKCKEHKRRNDVKNKLMQPDSQNRDMTSDYLGCALKYKEYGLLALTKATSLVKQVI